MLAAFERKSSDFVHWLAMSRLKIEETRANAPRSNPAVEAERWRARPPRE
jgi:hypothetical protein